tara:strand:- start:98 stop:1087 length:990 start_codon:yes stop_codon:yes gene_type:complete
MSNIVENFLNEMPNFSEGTKTNSIKPLNKSVMTEKQLERGMNIANLLSDTGNAWNVVDLPLTSTHEDGTILTTTSRGLFRSDNNENLGVVGARYEVMQNEVLAETLVDLQSQFGGDLRGGNLQDGKKVFFQLSLPQANIGNYQNNGVKRYISCLNSHDGSSSIGFGSTNEVVICSNTFHTALKDISKFRHTASASDRLAQAIKGFESAMNGEAMIIDTFKMMATAPIEKTIVEKVINNLFNPKGKTEVSTRTKNNVQMFGKAYTIEKEQKKEDTLWTLFNAVTRYTNHMEKKEKDLNHLMVGAGYKKNLIAYDTILRWLSEPTKTSVLV